MIITWTVFCLIGAVFSGLLAYRKEKNAVTYIAKLLFFIFLFSFLLLLLSSSLSMAPPPLREPPPVG